MQLRYLAIPHFRNLRDVEMSFAIELSHSSSTGKSEESKRIRSHALIGQNGTGKSNLIEALITLFRDIDLDREAAFDYTFEYEIRGNIIRINADIAVQKRPFVWVNDTSESQGFLLKNRELLPSHIFAYYSGRNERIEQLFQEHQRRFNLRQEITADEVISNEDMKAFTDSPRLIDLQEGLRKFDGKTINEMTDDELAEYHAIQDELKPFEEQRAKFLVRAEEQRQKRRARLGDDRLRRLFYCRGGHSQLVLLACLLSDDPVFRKVLDNLHIESLESALFVLKEPHRLREKRRNGKFDENELNEGDARFWFARGNVVNEFLDKLWQVSWAPIEQEATKQIDFRGRTEKQKQLYLFVPDKHKLNELGELVGSPDSFFRYAEGAYIGDLIDEVRITVKKRDEHGGKVSFTQLSEGELQMLTVLGLMRITREDQCLFLLDEPDTHLNPIWKLRYFDDIEGVLTTEKDAKSQSESQILITTHDPMMVGSLKKEQVHIIKNNGDRTLVEQPDEHPQGMGITGLLKSELFGLTSTLDVETERRLYRRNELFAKENKTPEENDELTRLSQELADLGFSMAEFKDPVYAMFVRKMAEHRKFNKPSLTADEIKEQDDIVDSIIDDILNGEE